MTDLIQRIEAAKDPRQIAFIGPNAHRDAARWLFLRKVSAILRAERKDDE